ncbi:YqgE/AlgH family protein [Chitinivibrio alkaliphilus]|uniref:Uncharacterized protein n=1 Tax=Chitinivibrio alkaliphilus ACht1 TaxID=1313304 RepID=U7D779_9BACT|nr:YqgE/AlgH family protein [Chitinivibrio alkaliphilus]ERP30947.1 hypothetical protein CALK_2196 [Chitinivibrio alkaliphilus ACht1]
MKVDVQKGSVLFASKALQGSYFQDALILLIEHNEDGTFGLIINRSARIPVREIFSPVPQVSQTTRIFQLGGPVGEEELHILTLTEYLPQEEEQRYRRQAAHEGEDHVCGYPFSPGVLLGGIDTSLEGLIASGSSYCKLFLGYTGWSSGQLVREIAEGSWEVFSTLDLGTFLYDVTADEYVLREQIYELLTFYKK